MNNEERAAWLAGLKVGQDVGVDNGFRHTPSVGIVDAGEEEAAG